MSDAIVLCRKIIEILKVGNAIFIGPRYNKRGL